MSDTAAVVVVRGVVPVFAMVVGGRRDRHRLLEGRPRRRRRRQQGRGPAEGHHAEVLALAGERRLHAKLEAPLV